MATNIGSLEFTVDADGRLLLSQIKRIGAQAGTKGGQAARDSFAKEFAKLGRQLTPQFRNLFRGLGGTIGNLLPRGLNSALRKMGASLESFYGKVRDGGRKLTSDLSENWTKLTEDTDTKFGRMFTRIKGGFEGVSRANAEFRRGFKGLDPSIGASFTKGAVAMNRFGRAVRQVLPDNERLRNSLTRTRSAFTSIGNSLKGFFSRFRTGSVDVDKQRSLWSRLSANGRQWTLIIGAIIAGMAQMSALTSALAGAVVILATAIAALAAGALVAVAGFAALFAEGTKLTAGAAKTKAAFQGLVDVFKGLQQVIVDNMFENMAPAVEGFGKALGGLKGPLADFASSVGDTITAAFQKLSDPAVIGGISKLLEGFGPIFDSLIKGVLDFGGAIGSIMIAALPFAQAFADAVADIGAKFATWAASDEGQARLTLFFQTAATLMPLVVDLVVALGKALANLVTPQSIASTGQLLTSLTNFMPVLSGILQIAGALNIFGLIAAALDAVGAAVTPLIAPLTDIATLVSTFLLTAFQQLTPLLAVVGTAIGQLLVAIMPIIGVVLNLATSVLTVLIPPLMTLVQAIMPPLIAIFAAIMPAIAALSPVIVTLVDALTPLITLVGGALAAALTAIAPLFDTVTEVILQLIPPILQIVTALLPPLTALFSAVMDVVIQLIPVVLALITPFLKLIPPLLQLIVPLLPPLVSLLTLVAQVVSSVLSPIIKALTPVIELLGGVIGDILMVALKVITPIIKVVADVLTGLMNVIKPLANFIADVLVGAIQGISKALEGVIGWIKDAINWFGNLFGAADQAESKGRSASSTGGAASGRLISGPRRILVGEGGPEAIVPLNRSLSMVDPSVRALSAIAQGKSTAAGGGVVGGTGRIVNIGEGAVQVTESGNGRQTAYDVLDVLANRIAG